MPKKSKPIKKFIPEAERELAAKFFTLSNLAMLEVVRNDGNLDSMYRQADEIMSFEYGASILPELRSWRKDIADGNAYCYDEWQKVRAKYVKEEVTARFFPVRETYYISNMFNQNSYSMELHFNMSGDPTKLPLPVAKETLAIMTEARDALTREMSKLRQHIAAEEAKPTLSELVIAKEDREGDPDVPITDNGTLVRIPKPKGEDPAWSFRNWEWIKGFCEAHPGAFPTNEEGLDHEHFDFIDCSKLDTRK